MSDDLSHLTGLPAPLHDDDPTWQWAHEQELPPGVPPPAGQVMAVLVTHEGEQWLPRALRALGRLDERPGLVVAVDASSSDGSRALLEQAVDEGLVDHLVDAPPTGFGTAIEAALAGVQERRPFLWLLHDDLEPQPSALGALLEAAAGPEHPDLLFPKVLAPRRRNHPDRLLEIGQSLSRGGARVLSVDPGDVDQHQVEPAATLGGSTAGALVRREAWDSLGGLDPDLPLFRDGVDLGWRAHDLGLVVRTAPRAAVHHHQVGRWGDRAPTVAGRGGLPALDRLLGLRLAAARSSRSGVARVRLWALSLLGALVMLLGKNLSEASAAWRAGWRILGDGAAVDRLRQRHQVAVPEGHGGTALRPGSRARAAWLLGATVDAFTDRYRDLREDPGDTSLDDLIGDDFAGGRGRSRLISPTTAVMVVLGLLCLAAARTLLGRGQLVSSQLLPAPSSAADAWAAWIHPTAGQSGSNPPWLAVVAAGSWLAAGLPELLVRAVVLGAPVWAALTFLALARTVVRLSSPRTAVAAGGSRLRVLRVDGVRLALLAALWGVVIAVLGVSQRGSVTAIAVAVVAPLVVSAALRWWSQDLPGAVDDHRPGVRWRAPGLVALWLALLGTALPLAWAVALVLAVAHAVTTGRTTLRTAVVGLGPLLTSAPWLVRLADDPGRLLTTADPTAQTLASLAAGPRPVGLLVGRLGEGTPALGVSLAVLGLLWGLALVVAVAALRRGRALPLALVGLALLAAAIGGGLAALVVDVDGVAVRPAADPWVVLMALALCCVLVWGVVQPVPRVPGNSLPRLLAAGMSLAVVLGAAGWQVAGPGPAVVAAATLPAHVGAVQESPRQSRALVVSIEAGVARWNLSAADTPQWGVGERHPAGPPSWRDSIQGLVASIMAAGPPSDLADQLAAHGIAHLWLRGATHDQVNALANTEGLVAAPSEGGATLVTVAGLVGRSSLDPGTGEWVPLPTATLVSGQQGTLRIAEPWDPRWRVQVGEQHLGSTEQELPGGARAVAATVTGPKEAGPKEAGPEEAGPEGAGQVSWSMRPSLVATTWHAFSLLVLLVLAAPTLGRPRLTDGTRFEEGSDR